MMIHINTICATTILAVSCTNMSLAAAILLSTTKLMIFTLLDRPS